MVEYRNPSFVRALLVVTGVLFVLNALVLLQTGALVALVGATTSAVVFAALLFRWRHVRAVVKTWAGVQVLGGGLGVAGGALVFLGMLMGGEADDVSGTVVRTLVSGASLVVGLVVFRLAGRYIVDDEALPAS
jgi:hypothetical protein